MDLQMTLPQIIDLLRQAELLHINDYLPLIGCGRIMDKDKTWKKEIMKDFHSISIHNAVRNDAKMEEDYLRNEREYENIHITYSAEWREARRDRPSGLSTPPSDDRVSHPWFISPLTYERIINEDDYDHMTNWNRIIWTNGRARFKNRSDGKEDEWGSDSS